VANYRNRIPGGGARVYVMCRACHKNPTSNGGGVCTPCLGGPVRMPSAAARRVAASYNPAGEAEARLTKRLCI
jgi:hypothetical protein